MSWMALLLIGLAAADLTHSVRLPPVRWSPVVVAPVVVVVLALFAGLWSWLAVPLIAVAAAGWAVSVREGFGRRLPWLPLGWLLLVLFVTLAGSGLAPPVGGLVGHWVSLAPWPLLVSGGPERALLVVAVLLVQLSTGNVVVRLVLAASGTLDPTREGGLPPSPLKGGRVLGPLERLLIVGLGLAGQLTAAAIVAAAKGLLRFPELSSRREQEHIHSVTEYFLVGTMLSWVFALGSLVLVG